MPNCKNLPGIVQLDYIASGLLTLYPKQFLIPGSKVSALGGFTPLRLVGMASCSTSNERTKAGKVYTTKVTGLIYDSAELDSKERDLLAEKLHCFRVTDVYKKKYLIGIDQKPFPEINFSPSNDGAPSGMRAVSFEITWISTLPPIEIIPL